MIRVGLDIDGVFADFNTPYAKFLAEEHGSDLLPEGWQGSNSAFVCWNWDTFYKYPFEVQKRVWNNRILGSKKFWLTLPQLEGAQEVLKKLNYLSKDGSIDCYFLTNRMGVGAKLQTEGWLYGCGYDYPTVMLASDKVPIIKALGLNFYMDDKLDTMLNLRRTANEEKWDMRDKHFILQDAAWNQVGRYDDMKVSRNVKDALLAAGIWR